ncbi:MAG: polysaccharide biosynthesis tyrosine autokinase [Thermodesulfobacteriota bacterium]|nr:polysaccharide biosynthesis tyrosine autokinase [Thermodesulfobacteriota bacterium]
MNLSDKNGHYPASSSAMALPIQYNQTRIVDVYPNLLRENRLVAFFEDAPAAEQYKILRTQVLHRVKEQGMNTILVTSPGQGEGKSLTAANLAASLAMDVAHTALLVDVDLKKPRLHQLFGISQDYGLADCLVNDIPLSQILINPGISRLTLLPGNTGLPDSAEIIGSPKMTALINEIKHRYQDRFIIFDTPPVLEKADALILSKQVDGAILVVEQGRTTKDQLKKAIDLLEATRLLGIVFNKVIHV